MIQNPALWHRPAGCLKWGQGPGLVASGRELVSCRRLHLAVQGIHPLAR